MCWVSVNYMGNRIYLNFDFQTNKSTENTIFYRSIIRYSTNKSLKTNKLVKIIEYLPFCSGVVAGHDRGLA